MLPPAGGRNMMDFNPRSPCGERHIRVVVVVGYAVISIHAPRVGSDCWDGDEWIEQPISIHAPRVGSDVDKLTREKMLALFQSTLPVWGATL